MDDYADRPTHPWNDPDGDGHNCADCPTDSMWKCDAAAHVSLPSGGAYGLLSEDQRAALDANLRDMAATRRRGNASAATMPLGAAGDQLEPRRETTPAEAAFIRAVNAPSSSGPGIVVPHYRDVVRIWAAIEPFLAAPTPEAAGLREALRAVLSDYDRVPTEDYLNEAVRIFLTATPSRADRGLDAAVLARAMYIVTVDQPGLLSDVDMLNDPLRGNTRPAAEAVAAEYDRLSQRDNGAAPVTLARKRT